MKQDIENIIRTNLPEKKEAGLYTTNKATGGDIINYNREDNDDKREGFNQALSQINTSLIADEVLKVVVEKIEEKFGKYKSMNGSLGYQGMIQGITAIQTFEDQQRDKIIELLSNLSTNKENKNND